MSSTAPQKQPSEQFYEAVYEVAKGAIGRSRSGAEFVEKAAAAIATIYTGALAVAFSVADKPLPIRGMIPAVYLALSIAGAAFYLGFPSGRGKVTPPTGEVPLEWANAYLGWSKRLTLHRAWAIRGAIVSLALGALFLPAPFIQVKPTPTTPPAAIEWPQATGTAQQNALFAAQVKEAARLREQATPTPIGRKVDERRIWEAAVGGLILVGAVVLLSWFGSAVRAIRDIRAAGDTLDVGTFWTQWRG